MSFFNAAVANYLTRAEAKKEQLSEAMQKKMEYLDPSTKRLGVGELGMVDADSSADFRVAGVDTYESNPEAYIGPGANPNKLLEHRAAYARQFGKDPSDVSVDDLVRMGQQAKVDRDSFLRNGAADPNKPMAGVRYTGEVDQYGRKLAKLYNEQGDEWGATAAQDKAVNAQFYSHYNKQNAAWDALVGGRKDEDLAAESTGWKAGLDTAKNLVPRVSSGFVGGLAEIPHFAASLVDAAAGTNASKYTGEFKDWVTDKAELWGISETGKARDRLREKEKAQYEKGAEQRIAGYMAKGDSEGMAAAKNFLDEAKFAFSTSNDNIGHFIETIAQSAASFLGPGLLGKGVKAAAFAKANEKILAKYAGKALSEKAEDEMKRELQEAALAATVKGQKWGFGASAAVEGLGLGGEVYDRIMAMDDQQFLATNPDVLEKVNAGMSIEDAKRQKAAQLMVMSTVAGTAAAAVIMKGTGGQYLENLLVGRVGAKAVNEAIADAEIKGVTELAETLTGKGLMAKLMGAGNAKLATETATSMATESLEEGLIGAQQGIFGNVAARMAGEDNRLLQGAGMQAGEGAAMGMGMAGTFGGVKAVGKAAKTGVVATATKVGNALDSAEDEDENGEEKEITVEEGAAVPKTTGKAKVDKKSKKNKKETKAAVPVDHEDDFLAKFEAEKAKGEDTDYDAILENFGRKPGVKNAADVTAKTAPALKEALEHTVTQIANDEDQMELMREALAEEVDTTDPDSPVAMYSKKDIADMSNEEVASIFANKSFGHLYEGIERVEQEEAVKADPTKGEPTKIVAEESKDDSGNPTVVLHNMATAPENATPAQKLEALNTNTQGMLEAGKKLVTSLFSQPKAGETNIAAVERSKLTESSSQKFKSAEGYRQSIYDSVKQFGKSGNNSRKAFSSVISHLGRMAHFVRSQEKKVSRSQVNQDEKLPGGRYHFTGTDRGYNKVAASKLRKQIILENDVLAQTYRTLKAHAYTALTERIQKIKDTDTASLDTEVKDNLAQELKALKAYQDELLTQDHSIFLGSEYRHKPLTDAEVDAAYKAAATSYEKATGRTSLAHKVQAEVNKNVEAFDKHFKTESRKKVTDRFNEWEKKTPQATEAEAREQMQRLVIASYNDAAVSKGMQPLRLSTGGFTLWEWKADQLLSDVDPEKYGNTPSSFSDWKDAKAQPAKQNKTKAAKQPVAAQASKSTAAVATTTSQQEMMAEMLEIAPEQVTQTPTPANQEPAVQEPQTEAKPVELFAMLDDDTQTVESLEAALAALRAEADTLKNCF